MTSRASEGGLRNRDGPAEPADEWEEVSSPMPNIGSADSSDGFTLVGPPAASAPSEPPAAATGLAGFFSELIADIRQPPAAEPPAESVDATVQEERFDYHKLISNVERFGAALGPISDAIDAVEDVMHWEDPNLTGGLLVFYLLCVWYNWLLPGLFLLATVLLGWSKVRRDRGDFDPSAATGDDSESEEEPGEVPARSSAQQTRGFWQTAANMVQGVSTKYRKMKRKGAKVQSRLALFSSRMEKLTMLLDWSVPSNTMMVLYALIAGMLVTAAVPDRLLWLGLQLNFGFSFFVKSYFFHTRVGTQTKYDSSYRFWCALPDKTSRLPQPIPYTVPPAPVSAAAPTGSGGGAADVVPAIPVRPASEVAPPANPTTAQQEDTPPVDREMAALQALGVAQSDIIEKWTCVRMGKKLTDSKTGKLILTKTDVCFVRPPGGPSSGSVKLQHCSIAAVKPGGAVKPASVSDSGSPTSKRKLFGMSAMLKSIVNKAGDKLGVGSLVLDVVDPATENQSSYKFGALTNRDQVGFAIGQAIGRPFERPE